jgi:CheY-like chemotaxis protein
VRILLADFDAQRLAVLSRGCQDQGYGVTTAQHGAAALELALESPPDMLVCPVDLPVIDGTRLQEILRGNPRTRHASFVFLLKDELDAPMSMDPRDATLTDPWSVRDLLAHIEASQTRTQRFGGSRPNVEIEGNLAQISVVDLLEIFQMNRRSGTVRIWRQSPPASGSIQVRGGQVLDASVPLADGSSVVGEKALYRLLTWKDGRFEFHPGEVGEDGRIRRPTRALLLEGLRQADEWGRLVDQLPPEDARLVLAVPRARIPTDLHPLTRETLESVEAYRRVREIVDHCSFPDYQVMRVLAGLLGRGALAYESAAATHEGRRSPPSAGLFSSAQLRRLREWSARQRPRTGSVIKLLAVSAQRESLAEFYEILRESPEFMTEPRVLRAPERLGGMGPLGHFPLGEGMSLRVLAVPAQPAYAPLWEVAAFGMLGAILLVARPDPSALAEVNPARESLEALCPNGVLHLFFRSGREAERLDLAEGALAQAISKQRVFVAPGPRSTGRSAFLNQLFARLVP